MNEYIGTKIIKAEPAYKVDGLIVTELPLSTSAEPKTAQDGYKVEYLDGYISWSPKNVFEESYKTSGSLNFGHVLFYLKLGCKLARKSWNKDNVYSKEYIEAQIPDDYSKMTKPYIYIKTKNGDSIPWFPSQEDIFAEDWEEIVI